MVAVPRPWRIHARWGINKQCYSLVKSTRNNSTRNSLTTSTHINISTHHSHINTSSHFNTGVRTITTKLLTGKTRMSLTQLTTRRGTVVRGSSERFGSSLVVIQENSISARFLVGA